MKYLAIIVTFLVSFNSLSQSLKPAAENILIHQYNFETSTEISNWVSEKGSTEISDKHFKDGKNSLLWNWTKKDFLVVENMEGLNRASQDYKGGIPEFYEPAYFPEGKYGGVKMWLYQEKPQQGTMFFHVGSNVKSAKKNPKYKFEISLDFKGWRTVWVSFEQDAKVENYNGDETMRSFVAFPSEKMKGKGQLFIDHFTLLDFVSYKRHSDLIFENSKQAARTDSYKILNPYKEYLSKSFSNHKVNLEDLKANSNIISERLTYLILGDETQNWKKRNSSIEKRIASLIKSSKKYYEKLNISKHDNYVNGVPLFSSRDEHPAEKVFNYQAVGQATFFPLAMDYRINDNNESKEKMINMLDYFEDQGWVAGSAFGTVDHVIRLNPIAQAIFLMKEELEAQDKLQDRVEMLVWHSRIGGILDLDYTRGENTDKVRGAALVKLITVLLMEETPKKDVFLQAFKEYMDFVISYAPGYSDTIKTDFSIFHHSGTYLNSYGIQAVNTMAMVHWLLQNTPYALSSNSTEILKKTLLRQSEIAFGEDLHFGVCGRFPDKNAAIGRFLLPAFAFMSMNENQILDIKLAERYAYLYDITKPKDITGILSPALTYSGTFGTIDLMVRLKELANNKVSKPTAGNYSMPYSSMSVHRTENTFVSVKGYNKYVWDFETGYKKGENCLGRYLSHGALFVAQGDPEKGFLGLGIDYNGGFHQGYLPGATTKALPIEKVYHKNIGNKKYIEGYHRSFTKTTFAGGLSQKGLNGIYAMELRDDVGPDPEKVLFDNSFRAKKSYFFIGDEIICLGSNIKNDDEKYATITTLFQYKFNEQSLTSYNGVSLGNSLTIDKNVNGGYFTDQNGVHYLLGEDSRVRIEQNLQKSLKRVGKKYENIDTPHVKAYLDHGVAPKSGSYEYQILMNTSKEKAAAFVTDKSYKVVSKNEKTHSIYHEKSNTYAYAIFNEKETLSGPLLKTDTPILTMIKQVGNKSVLTVANPDLMLPAWNHNMSHMPDEIVNGNSEGSIVTVTIKGIWFSAKDVNELKGITHKEGNSVLEIYCKDGKSIDIPLQQRL